jgi:hypothetical protein
MTPEMEDIREKTPNTKTGGEKTDSAQKVPTYEEGEGFVREFAAVKDGIELHPKPTSDPLDPLNFPKARKFAALGVVMWKFVPNPHAAMISFCGGKELIWDRYFIFTYLTTTTVPSFGLLQEQYNISFSQVNWTVAIPALGLTVGPLIWSSLADIYGRRVIFIIGSVIALVSTIGAAVAQTYSGYMAARFFQGFGVSHASTVGMAIINDVFFEHERGQKVGLWTLSLDLGLLVGPLGMLSVLPDS